MRVLFVLPAPVRVPSGGAAVVYRHARGLVERGHEVTVASPLRPGGLAGAARAWAVRAVNRVQKISDAPWFDPGDVRTLELAHPSALDPSGFDSVIATGFQTAFWVHDAIGERSSGCVYFVQGDERYQHPSAESTWALPFHRVTVSQWLADELAAHGASVEAVVPNAVDPTVFSPARPVEQREERVVALYHRHPVKGPDTLIDALKRLRTRHPGLRADVVSARIPSHSFPFWVSVHVRPPVPELVELMSRAAVCLHTSRLEGWGLFPMEAAACGCAIVATASRGVSEYLEDGRSMRQVDVGDAEALSVQASRWLADPSSRTRYAQAAIEDVARFSWAASTARLEHVLEASV